MVPVIHSLVFVYASQRQIVDFKHNYYYNLQFVTWKAEDGLVYLTVPEKEMKNFIEVCKQTEQEVHFYKIDEINKGKDKIDIAKGKRVRVHGGPFDQVEGYFIKIGRKRGKQLVVIIPDLLAVSAEVAPEYIQVIDWKLIVRHAERKYDNRITVVQADLGDIDLSPWLEDKNMW